jgi:hypothetical protein
MSRAGLSKGPRFHIGRYVGTGTSTCSVMALFSMAVLAIIVLLTTPALATESDRRTCIIKQLRLETDIGQPEAIAM